MFQNLRANNQLFILHKDENPLVDIGSVVSVSAAKPKYPMPTPIGQIPQMEMVVDVVVCVNGQNTTFQNLPAGADIADFGQNGNIVISCSREAMNSEVSAIRQKSLKTKKVFSVFLREKALRSPLTLKSSDPLFFDRTFL